MRPRIAVVTGPTASGKTALAIALAKRLGGEVVSADSMQVYRGLDIGTAKPTAEEMDGVAHHMLDVADPAERYSVSRYAQEAAACVDAILARGRLPIVCGGTGLYIDALVRGQGFQPGGDPDVRAALARDWHALGPRAMMERLRAVDPEAAGRLHIGDQKRILRALEVYTLTGRTISQHNARTRTAPARYDARTVALWVEPRQALYDRIDARVADMLARGLVAEAEALYRAGALAGTAGQAIGYKELIAYFEGSATLEAAAARIAQGTRRYAKRQMTWLRGRPEYHPIILTGAGEKERAAWEATIFLCGDGLK